MQTVVITTDIFRCREFGLKSVAENASWLRGLLHNVFSPNDFTPSIFISECDEGDFEVGRYRRAHNLPSNASGWAKLVNTTIPVQDEPFFCGLLGAHLVIGWGLTPALIQLLDRHRIPFVDVEVDPIRFADDILLRVRTNSTSLSNYFLSLHVDEAAFSTSVAEVRAFVARLEPSTVRKGRSFGLFAGQCAIDLSTVKAGRVAQPVDYIRDIRAVAECVDTLLIKPHPGDDDLRHITGLLDAIPNARMTGANIYRILPDINLKHVVALSSSVLDEAATFGVQTTRLIKADRDASDLIPPSTSQWYRIPAEGMTSSGLVNAFQGMASPVPNVPRRRFDLRRSLNTSWGLEDFYTNPQLSLNSVPHQRRALASLRRKMSSTLRSLIGQRPLKQNVRSGTRPI